MSPRVARSRGSSSRSGIGIARLVERGSGAAQVDDYVSREPAMRRSALFAEVAGGSDDEGSRPLLLAPGRVSLPGLQICRSPDA